MVHDYFTGKMFDGLMVIYKTSSCRRHVLLLLRDVTYGKMFDGLKIISYIYIYILEDLKSCTIQALIRREIIGRSIAQMTSKVYRC